MSVFAAKSTPLSTRDSYAFSGPWSWALGAGLWQPRAASRLWQCSQQLPQAQGQHDPASLAAVGSPLEACAACARRRDGLRTSAPTNLVWALRSSPCLHLECRASMKSRGRHRPDEGIQDLVHEERRDEHVAEHAAEGQLQACWPRAQGREGLEAEGHGGDAMDLAGQNCQAPCWSRACSSGDCRLASAAHRARVLEVRGAQHAAGRTAGEDSAHGVVTARRGKCPSAPVELNCVVPC